MPFPLVRGIDVEPLFVSSGSLTGCSRFITRFAKLLQSKVRKPLSSLFAHGLSSEVVVNSVTTLRFFTVKSNIDLPVWWICFVRMWEGKEQLSPAPTQVVAMMYVHFLTLGIESEYGYGLWSIWRWQMGAELA